jgi:hypothetical protein
VAVTTACLVPVEDVRLPVSGQQDVLDRRAITVLVA